MLRRIFATFVALFICCTAALAATLSPTLESQLGSAADDVNVGTVIVAFNTQQGLNDSHLAVLRGVGIARGLTLPQLGMVAVPSATAGQVRGLAANSAVRSVWSNDQLYYFMNQARVLTGVDRVRTTSAFTKANGGLPVAGQGNFSVVINDSGIDANHPDLKFGSHVVQNVQILADTDTLAGFTTLVAVENVPNTDTHVGHGTHCAGIVGATGQQSGGRYAGVAPGAKLIGTGSGAGLFILNALGGYEWSLSNQFLHNIRVISNSWGSSGPFNPDNPINMATKHAYDNNIISVFAAGNAGPGWDTHNPYAKAPWVISVGAGTKEGGLVGFSSRGTPKEERLNNADPNDDNDAPTIVAPGTGRQFASNAAKFTSDVVSTRATSNVVSNGADADLEIPTAYLPYYTQISGTSMACPHVAGVVALMLDADSTLTPDDVKRIIRETATRMPVYGEFEVGSGYINAFAAVDKVFNRSRDYGRFVNPSFNAQLTTTWSDPTNFSLMYIPQPPGPQETNTNTYRFNVEPGRGLLNVVITFGTNAATTETGNSMGLMLYPPGCQTPQTDPTAPPPPCAFNSGLALPALNAPQRQVIVRNPVAGQWVAEVRGVRGLAAVPQVSSPVGIAVPEQVNGYVKTAIITLQDVADIQAHAAETAIRNALLNRRIDLLSDGTFQPDANVTRADFARVLSLNAPLRQSLGATARFTDVSGDLASIAEAITTKGSTLRDFFTAESLSAGAGLMSADASTFNPGGTVSRLDLAVAMVRALGLDAEAKAKANTDVTFGGQTVIDNAQIPGALRGYVQIAIDKGLLEVYPAEVRQIGPGQFLAIPGPRVEPNALITRAALATKVNIFEQRFVAGN